MLIEFQSDFMGRQDASLADSEPDPVALALAEALDDDVVSILDKLPLLTRVIDQCHRFTAAPRQLEHRSKSGGFLRNCNSLRQDTSTEKDFYRLFKGF